MKTFKVSALLLATLAVAIVFDGCKKGENDPFLSIKSRKSRVVGEWKVTSQTRTDENKDITEFMCTTTVVTTGTYNYDGAVETGSGAIDTTITGTGCTYSGSGTFTDTSYWTLTININKDGTFEYTLTETTPLDANYSETWVYKGTWNFTGGVGDVKSKEQLLLNTTEIKYTESDNGVQISQTETYSGFPMVYNIDELRSKKIVLTWEDNYIQSDGDYDKSSYTQTLELQ